MSKETTYPCGKCGGSFAFMEYHTPHCPGVLPTAPLPRGLQAIADGLAAAGRAIGHDPVLAKEAAERTVRAIGYGGGGMKDKPVRKKRPNKKSTKGGKA